MEQYNLILQSVALAAGAAWASGINLYALLLMLGLGGASGYMDLPQELSVVEHPLVIAAAGLMYCVEFFADKIPGVDTFWDTLHTFVRIPAGAMLAAGAMGDVSPALAVAAGVLGGGMSATSHATKASARMLINTSPEPFSNWGASISEDVLVVAGLWTALHHPVLFLILLVMFVALVVWLLPKIWGLIASIVKKIGRFFGLVKGEEEPKKEVVTVEPPSRTLSQTEVVSALERLQKLREKGTLTEEEFIKQKQALLN